MHRCRWPTCRACAAASQPASSPSTRARSAPPTPEPRRPRTRSARSCACRRRARRRRRAGRSRARGRARPRGEAVGGADGVDLEGSLARRRRPVRAGPAIVADSTRPSPSARTITWPQTIRRTRVAVARVVDQPPGIGGHPRRGGEPVAAAGGLGDRDDLGPACRQLRRDRQQERSRAGQQDAPAGQDALALGQRLRAAGGHRARQRPAREGDRPVVGAGGEHDGARAHPRRRPPVSSSTPGAGTPQTERAGEHLRARGGEARRIRRARPAAASAERLATSSKRRRQIWPPGAAYSSISATEAPARRAATAAAIPAGPPPTTATSTCVSSLIGTSVRAL